MRLAAFFKSGRGQSQDTVDKHSHTAAVTRTRLSVRSALRSLADFLHAISSTLRSVQKHHKKSHTNSQTFEVKSFQQQNVTIAKDRLLLRAISKPPTELARRFWRLALGNARFHGLSLFEMGNSQTFATFAKTILNDLTRRSSDLIQNAPRTLSKPSRRALDWIRTEFELDSRRTTEIS